MKKWKCAICGWIYDPQAVLLEKDIKPGTSFKDLPDDFRCPECGAMKKWFEAIEE